MAAPVVVPIRSIRPRLFEGIAPADVKTIMAVARTRRYLAGSVIVNQGHPAEHCYLLISGRARYFYVTPAGRKIILMWVRPGDIFSPAALLSEPVEYLMSTEATNACSVLVWDRATIRAIVTRYPKLLENGLLTVFDYFTFYRAAHASMACENASQRLARVLAHVAEGIGRRVPGGVELDVRNEELANEANVTPYTASRLLSQWQRQGILVKSRGKVVLRSLDRLFREEF